jgi:hypothetical protein
MVQIRPYFHKFIWILILFLYFSLEAHVFEMFSWALVHMDFIGSLNNNKKKSPHH